MQFEASKVAGYTDRVLFINNCMKTMNELLRSDLSLQTLSQNELEQVDGGWWQGAVAAAGAAIYVYNNWDDFVKGFNEGLES